MDHEYVWANDISLRFLERDYLLPGLSLDDRVTDICNTAERTLCMSGFAKKLKGYVKRGFYSFSTPVWTNFGTRRGLPISCYGSYISDSMSSILQTHAEIGMMSKHGGGTSAYFGNLRGRGAPITNNGTSSGSVNFMQLFDQAQSIISQGATRRGSCAAYLPIDHPDINEFLCLHEEGNPIQDLSWGVCVPDSWLEDMIEGDATKRAVWARVLERRSQKGFPYIFFSDNANNQKPQCYKDWNLGIHATNLCSEVMLPSGIDESFVCCLGSMNLRYYNEWKDTDAVETYIYFLDAVMTDFIEKAHCIPFMERAVRFARNHRALGLGVLGWHSLLQSRMIPFESMQAKNLNATVFQQIREQAEVATKRLAELFGEPTYCKGYGRRNATLLAVAPTKSSSRIHGQVSEGIEPYRTNYHVDDTAKLKWSFRNPFLQCVLEEKGQNTENTWLKILKAGGSVQGLDCLTDHEKEVFKTFAEISPREVIIQAAQRQKYIDQGQSLNLMIHPSTPTKDVNALVLEAWRLGVKSLYYQYSINASQAVSRDILQCVSCEA